jgi:uncharacterized protein GlcG (DUF336 family)
MHVMIAQAQKIVEASRAKAEALNTQMCIALVDSGGNLKAFYRMDDAWVGSIDISQKKAKTALFFGMMTGQIGQLSHPNGPCMVSSTPMMVSSPSQVEFQSSMTAV